MTYTNVFYFAHLNTVGGVETFYYYLAKKYRTRDITIFYRTGDINQIQRLSRYVRVIRFQNGMKIKCKRIFFNFNIDIIDSVEAEEYYQIAHGDYQAIGKSPAYDQRITKFIGVTKHVADIFSEIRNAPVELCYNPVLTEDEPPAILLVSATRLTKEKGRRRMEILAETLEAKGISYLWLVFTDDHVDFRNPNIVLMSPRLDILPYIGMADYVVQLSDTEAFCYTVIESLTAGTPVIVTDLPVYKELGVDDSNSIRLPLDMSDIPTDKIIQGFEPFEYKPKKDRWNVILGRNKSTYNKELERKQIVRVIKPYLDLDLHKTVRPGDVLMVDKERADYLVDVRQLCERKEE
jgi:glycosyltransferase involved in cell wall biosynthesis